MPERLAFEARFDVGDEGVISGYAARFDELVPTFKEVVKAGAFRRTLLEHRAAGTNPVMLWNHDPAQVIGLWTDLEEDRIGLRVSGRIVTETRAGADAFALVKAKAATGLSIAFRARLAQRNANGVRELLDLDVPEISVVAMPAARRARIDSTRSDRAGAAVPVLLALREAARSIRSNAR